MTPGRQPFRLAMVALSCGLVVAGSWVAYREAAPYFAGGILPQERFTALVEDSLRPGPSIASQRLVLTSCVDAITSVYGRIQPTERRGIVQERCLEIAEQIGATDRTDSLAWYVAALTASRLGRPPLMNGYIRSSQQTGPNEQWLAELRVALAEDNFANLEPDTLRGHEADLRLLAVSPAGVRSIARRYVDDAGFRERITAVVETMDPSVQRRFVDQVQAAVGNRPEQAQ